MAKKFIELRKAMSPESQIRAHEKAAEDTSELLISDFCRARRYTQEQFATGIEIELSSGVNIEKNVDKYISTLRRFIEAMGGQLEIRVCFPYGEININQFEGEFV